MKKDLVWKAVHVFLKEITLLDYVELHEIEMEEVYIYSLLLEDRKDCQID